MRPTHRSRALALLLTAAAVGLAGCGSDDGGDGASGGTDAGGTAGTATNASATSVTAVEAETEALPATMAEWDQLWETERAAVVERIKTNGWGVSADQRTLTGPEGFTIDLSSCPAGWSNTEGLTDTEITIGYPAALSGANAEAGNIANGHVALFEHENAQGGFTDSTGKTRKVRMVLKDDGYDPARTIPLVDELIDAEKVFAVETMGSPASLRTYDKLNERCVPHLLPASGHPARGDPVNHPWTTTSSISYATEAVMWGTFIEEHLEELRGAGSQDTVKVAALRMNNDFGASYHAALEAYLATSPNRDAIEYVSETFEPTAAVLTDEMTTLAAEEPDVFIAMTTGSSCSQIIAGAAENGMKEAVPYKFLSSACKATTPVTKLGDQPDGWWAIGGGLKDATIAAYDGDAFIAEARTWISDAGYQIGPSFNLGLYYSWILAQSLRIAGELDGGLNRANLILAMRTIDMTHPMLLGGLKVQMNGNADAFMLEGSDISTWSSAEQTWEQDSLLQLAAQTPNCAWDATAAACG
ncbi:MAG: ABC transporter substrate-binding protein [Acidimicrobiales bacterium]